MLDDLSRRVVLFTLWSLVILACVGVAALLWLLWRWLA